MLASERFYLGAESFIFFGLSANKGLGLSELLCYTVRSKYVHISHLVLRVLEAFCLDIPLFEQFIDNIVYLAEANPHFAGEVTLGQSAVAGQHAEGIKL